VELTTLPPSCDDGLAIWEPLTPGSLRVCPGLCRDCFAFLHMTFESLQLHANSIGFMTMREATKFVHIVDEVYVATVTTDILLLDPTLSEHPMWSRQNTQSTDSMTLRHRYPQTNIHQSLILDFHLVLNIVNFL